MDGLLVIDKPAGPTSFDVVTSVRLALREGKAGHTGTLDPMATGVLPVCLGEATKVAPFVAEGDKEYDGVAVLGEERDTQDATGKTVAAADWRAATEAAVREAMGRLVGTVRQVPPMYSAVKVAGRRLYALAREGKVVEREPRTVLVHCFELTRFEPPRVAFHVRCGKGTYVRTLAHDLGKALGYGAYLEALRRTRTGRFTLADAVALDEVVALAQRGAQSGLAARLIGMSDALSHMPAVRLDDVSERRARTGSPLAAADVGATGLAQGARVRLVSVDGLLVAVAEVEGARLRYLRVFRKGTTA